MGIALQLGSLAPAFRTDRFHRGPSQDEALARLRFLVDEGRRLGLLLGGHGSGKTWLLECFRRELVACGQNVAGTTMSVPGRRAIFESLLAQLGARVPLHEGAVRLGRRLADHVRQNDWFDRKTILLLDDTHRAGRETLADLERLIDGPSAASSCLTVVLAADASQAFPLNTKLLHLADLRIDLEGWSAPQNAAWEQNSTRRDREDADFRRFRSA